MNNETTNTIAPISLSEIDGAPRVLDVDIGERLGLNRPRVIRELITRNLAEIEGFGPLAALRGKSRGQDFTEFWLNEEQALLLAVLSNAPHAASVRAMLIRTFVDWRRGHLETRLSGAVGPRDVHVAFRSFYAIGRMIGLEGNETALAANRATVRMTGVDALAAMGAMHLIAAKQEELLTATMIGQRLDGISGKAVNKRLEALGFHESHTDSRDYRGWHPTEKGTPFGVWLDTSKSHNDGTSVRQWKWTADIIPEIQGGAAVELVTQATLALRGA